MRNAQTTPTWGFKMNNERLASPERPRNSRTMTSRTKLGKEPWKKAPERLGFALLRHASRTHNTNKGLSDPASRGRAKPADKGHASERQRRSAPAARLLLASTRLSDSQHPWINHMIISGEGKIPNTPQQTNELRIASECTWVKEESHGEGEQGRKTE